MILLLFVLSHKRFTERHDVRRKHECNVRNASGCAPSIIINKTITTTRCYSNDSENHRQNRVRNNTSHPPIAAHASSQNNNNNNNKRTNLNSDDSEKNKFSKSLGVCLLLFAMS